jgi:hypothetical protein
MAYPCLHALADQSVSSSHVHCSMLLLWHLDQSQTAIWYTLPCRDGVDEASSKDGATALGLAIQNNRPDVLGQASREPPGMLAARCIAYNSSLC